MVERTGWIPGPLQQECPVGVQFGRLRVQRQGPVIVLGRQGEPTDQTLHLTQAVLGKPKLGPVGESSCSVELLKGEVVVTDRHGDLSESQVNRCRVAVSETKRLFVETSCL